MAGRTRQAEALRREAIIAATIEEIGTRGTLDVTVSQIARRARISPALAHHYFGSKEGLFLAAMRQILRDFAAAVRAELKSAESPRARLSGIVRASFSAENFRPEKVAAWLNFYALARSNPAAAELLAIYHRRLRSNLLHELRPLLDDAKEAPAPKESAELLAALIDGVYLRQALRPGEVAPQRAVRMIEGEIDRLAPRPALHPAPSSAPDWKE